MKKTVTILILFAIIIGSFSQVPEDWQGKVMTVNGLIPADSMGITLPHEHLLIVHKYNYLDLTDETEAITELGYYANAGGKTLFEASNIGIGRNPEGLKRISTATGVNVVMCAGYYKDQWIPDSIKNKSVGQLTEIIINDIINGINGIHAGFIKIAMSRPITPFEEKVLIAAAHAQKATGVAIEVHFDGDLATTVQKHHVLDVFENEGVDLTRVCLNHAVPYTDLVDDFITLAQRGCYLAFDMQGLEVRVAFQHERKLAETLNALIGQGYLEQILISQDVCFSVCYVKNGGYGYAHILNNIVPQLKTSGITDEQIYTMMVENPKRMFPFKRDPDVGQCVNATYTSASGTVTDNSGTSDYLNNMSCSKLIQPSNCSSVTLTFTAFDTESGNDVISVYDGSTTSSPLLGQYSGNALPPVLTSTGGSMLLVFTTNGDITASGWSASYYSTLNTDYTGPCVNETFTAMTGTITDNSGSPNYYNNMSCQKLIQPTGAVNVTLTFNSFATESGYDFVKVYDGATTSATLLGQFSGTSLPAAVSSTGSSMLIVFTTDNGVVAAGWSATYTGNTTFTGNCVNETFTAMTGTITDNSGSANYYNNMSCQKLIQPTGAVNVTLTFNSFATESGYDFVKVYDGATTSSPLLGQYSGTALPPVLTSTGGSMLILFTTDNDIVAAGWSATYTGNAPVLSVTPESGSISSASGTTTFTVTSNIEWSVSDSSNWLTATKTDATTLTVSYDENTSLDSRSAEITVSGAGVTSQNIMINQSGASPALSVTPESGSISSASGTTTFTVTSNIEWSVSDSSNWLTATKTDSTTLTVSYDENTSVDSRSADITVSGAGVTSQNIRVNQSGANPVLIVTPESGSIGSEPGTTAFTVTSNIEWSVSEGSGWITAIKTNDTTLTVSYDENAIVDSRSAEITVRSAGVTSQNIKINQSGANPVLIVTPESGSISSEPGTTTFTVTANIDWSVSESSNWVTATKTDATMLTVSYDENTSVDSRSAEITVSYAGVSSQNIMVNQSGASPVLIVSPKSRSMSAAPGTTTFTIASNIDWSISESSDWVSALKTDAAILVVSYDKNTSEGSRVSEITVIGAGVAFESVYIIQEGAIPTTIKQPSEIPRINVFPNPVSDKTWLTYSKGTAEFIEIYEPSGRLIIRLQDSDENGVTEIDFSGLNSGLYIYRLIDTEGNIYNGKILKE